MLKIILLLSLVGEFKSLLGNSKIKTYHPQCEGICISHKGGQLLGLGALATHGSRHEGPGRREINIKTPRYSF